MKYAVECGGWVSLYHSETMTVEADSEVEAANKAKDRFCNQHDCECVTANVVRQIRDKGVYEKWN